MNRRSFFSAMLLAGAAPALFIRALEGKRPWKRGRNLWIRNPEYDQAYYTYYYTSGPFGEGNVVMGLLYRHPHRSEIRLKFVDGAVVEVPKMIQLI